MAGIGKRTYLRDVNPYLICPLCRGYLIDATTVVECLHSFCRSCILKHLNTEAHCPTCNHVLNKAKPNIKADKALQDIVYKLVPGLYHKEMRKRREFYRRHPEHADVATPEQRGEDVSGRLIFAPEDAVSLSLEYLPPGADPLTILLSTNETDHASNNNNSNANSGSGNVTSNRRYLQCPALVTIAHLKKFLALKYSVDMTRYTIEICHRRAPLPEHWTLMDVAYIYAWKRNAPMRFFYRVAQEEQALEAPLHERPSTPGLGASLPPSDNSVDARDDDAEQRPEVERTAKDDGKVDGKVDGKDDDKDESTEKSENKSTKEKLQQPSVVACDRSKEPKTVQKENGKVDAAPSSTIAATTLMTFAMSSTVTTVTSTINTVHSTTATMSVSTTPATATATSMATSVTTVAATVTTTSMATSTPTSMATSTATTTTANTVSTTTSTMTNTITSTINEEGGNKQIKTPIKILKNSDGKYEVLRSPPPNWHSREQNANPSPCDVKTSTNPEFSVVSIGDGQNSNGVKITLKQCSPGNTSLKKPKVISNVLLHCGQVKVEPSGGLLFRQLQKDKGKQQSTDKQEKQKRRVTFMDKPTTVKTIFNAPKTVVKKTAEQNDRKKQFLQGFQLAAKESSTENVLTDKGSKIIGPNTSVDVNESATQTNTVVNKKEQIIARNNSTDKTEGKEEKPNTESAKVEFGNLTNDNKTNNVVTNVCHNIKPNNAVKPFGENETRVIGVNAPRNVNASPGASSNSPAKMDVYAFPNDPPVVPVGAVKRKCPPGLPISEVKRKRQQAGQTQPAKKANASTQSVAKASRKCGTDQMVSPKKPVNSLTDSGPSRTVNVAIPKTSPSNPLFSSDTRNLLDGCGLNIPASLSITLTAPKSPGSGGSSNETNDTKDNRKNVLGKVSPSITLNDRCVDPRVLKALKTGQLRMPAPPKPRQTKQVDRETGHQRQTAAGKRKREQESREILDLSGGKKMDMHPLRIPQPVTKLKAKSPIRENMPGITDQGQVVTLMSGHRYYRAPPGSLTPAAHRVSDCPLPTPGRTPVYAPAGLSGSMNGNRTNTSLSSVFPSLQSLYVLNQAPNLQQFQMDAMLRLPRAGVGLGIVGNGNAGGNAGAGGGGVGSGIGGGVGGGVGGVGGIGGVGGVGGGDSTVSNIASSESASVGGGNVPGKSHLAAQCAPVKPARSSVAPLAVPIAKHQPSERAVPNSLNRQATNDSTKSLTVRTNDATPAPADATQRPSTQTRYSPAPETNEKFAARNENGRNTGVNDEEKTIPASPASAPRDLRVESTPDNSNEPESDSVNQQQRFNREAASPRVSSTASPSPPPTGSNGNACGEENRARQHDEDSNVVDRCSDGTRNDVPSPSSALKSNPNAEVSSTKSPASPDSSSVAAESALAKGSPTVDQQTSSSTQEPERTIAKASDSPTKIDASSVREESPVSDAEKNKTTVAKLSDAKQMTSEMLQKRLLAAFPTNEWASNPIAAEHLGNFLKSLNASMKNENNSTEQVIEKTTMNDNEKDCNKTAPTNNEVSSNQQKEIGERS